MKIAKDDAERNTLWTGRRGAFGAVSRLRPSYMVCDGTVPRTKLPEVLKKVTEIRSEVQSPHRQCVPRRRRKSSSIDSVRYPGRGGNRAGEEGRHGNLALCAWMQGGTISGEHGIGLEKLEEMSFIFSSDDIAAMWKLKNAFDPAGQLNPGKVLPPLAS